MSDDLVMDELFGVMVDEKANKEATRKECIPTGRYLLRAKNVKRTVDKRESFQSGDPNPNYDRESLNIFAAVFPEGDAEKPIGFIPIDASYQMRKTLSGKPDNPSKRWAEFCQAFGATASTSVGEVAKMIQEYPFMATITKNYKTAEGWRTVKAGDSEADQQYLDAGYEPVNFVQGIGKVK